VQRTRFSIFRSISTARHTHYCAYTCRLSSFDKLRISPKENPKGCRRTDPIHSKVKGWPWAKSKGRPGILPGIDASRRARE